MQLFGDVLYFSASQLEVVLSLHPSVSFSFAEPAVHKRDQWDQTCDFGCRLTIWIFKNGSSSLGLPSPACKGPKGGGPFGWIISSKFCFDMVKLLLFSVGSSLNTVIILTHMWVHPRFFVGCLANQHIDELGRRSAEMCRHSRAASSWEVFGISQEPKDISVDTRLWSTPGGRVPYECCPFGRCFQSIRSFQHTPSERVITVWGFEDLDVDDGGLGTTKKRCTPPPGRHIPFWVGKSQ